MKASELAKALGGTLEGADVELVACGGLEEARAGDLSFCKDPKHVKLVQETKASAVLLPLDWANGAPCSIIRVADPNHACMAAAKLFAPPEPVRAPGVHPTACVDPGATLGAGVDRLVRGREAVGEMADAALLQAAAGELADSLCEDVVSALARDPAVAGCALRHRFSPGYGDLPLSVQPAFLAALDATRRLGIALTSSFLMVPTKSVTAFVGVARPSPGGS